MNKMKNSKTILSESEITEIESAIKKVEMKTSAEIVPVIATSSGQYQRAEDLFAMVFSLFLLSSVWLWVSVKGLPVDWSDEIITSLNLPAVLIILFVSFIAGVRLANFFPELSLPFITKKEIKINVEHKAREVFQRLSIRNTKYANGILIYVSLFERQVKVLGDHTVNEKIPDVEWEVLCDTVAEGFKKNAPAKAMREGILYCGRLLEESLLIRSVDVNEMQDKLHLID